MPIPQAAYIHIPFCVHRCGYCNFTVVAGREDLIDTYLHCLELELGLLGTARPVQTIFVGGGTPTHLSLKQLDILFGRISQWFLLKSGGEFSVEANPADLTEEKAALLRRWGVTRLSLGGQAFSSQALRVLERDHDPERLRRAIRIALRHFASVSLDLIFAVPGQSLRDWEGELQAAVESGVSHLSTYGLTFEKGTSFWSRREHGTLAEADEELQRQMYVTAMDRLAAAEFEHYEISNFALPGHRCRHNEVYWSGGEFYAAGAGASRYVQGRRETNHRSTTTYIKRMLAGISPVAESEWLTPEARARELAVFGMRRLAGVNRQWFAGQTGLSLDGLFGPALAKYIQLGLLVDDGKSVRLTRSGLLVSDAIWPDLL